MIDALSTAKELLAALAAKQVSARELLALYDARIDAHNPQLNVIVERNPERADALEDRAPLRGLPITLKESINVRGMRTTMGTKQWEHNRSEYDGAIAERTRAAGAVLLGKTNVPPMLADWQANNPIYGRTNNPWDLTRSPGGSTAGAAAVAAGLTALEYGSDLAGSIRVPAALCGVYGHRPSETALPRSGQGPLPPLPNASRIMGVQGPLARSAEDLELAFDVVAGAEIGEDVGWRLELPPPRHPRLADFRVAVLPAVDWAPVDPAILAAQERLVERLRAHGCRVAEAQPALELRQTYELYLALMAIMTSLALTAEQREARLAQLRERDDVLVAGERRGLASHAGDYIKMFAVREHLRAAWRSFFREWDVVLAPAFMMLAFPHLESPRDVQVVGKTVPYGLGSFYPHVATLPGLPATAFPVELSREGLPIGLQAIGPYLEDRTLFRFAALLAREWGGFVAPPSFA
ncbi:MAG TPA: amidase family protein [Polyangiales bacterium]|nr:amidase family protein [Polyangiales bacterium]